MNEGYNASISSTGYSFKDRKCAGSQIRIVCLSNGLVETVGYMDYNDARVN